MHCLLLIVYLPLLGLFGCSDKSATAPQPAVATMAAELPAATPAEPEAAAAAAEDECVRGEPEALLAGGSEFTRNGTRTALELIPGTHQPSLAIRHYGCTAYALEFQFQWSQGTRPALPESLAQAQSTLEGLQFKDDYQPVMKQIIATLKPLKAFDEPVNLSETDTLVATGPVPNELLLRYEVAL